MKVSTLCAVKNAAIFLILFYADAQLLDKLFAAKSLRDIIVFLVSLLFMLAILIAHSHLFYDSVAPKEKETKNDWM